MSLQQVAAPTLASAVRRHELSNGLQVLALEDSTIPSVALNLIYRVGSRNEGAGRTGLAHFFEHMMFNGSRRYGPGEFDRVLESQGANNNAYTTKDITVYQEWLPPEALPVVLDLESDRMGSLSLEPALIESERGVVASERRRYMSEPEVVLDELLYATAFTAHPYRWPVLGWMVDIESWTVEDLQRFYRTNYAPNNATLILAGDLKSDEAFELVEKHFGELQAQPARRAIHTLEPPQTGERRARVVRDTALAQLQMAWHVPATSHEDFWALSVLEKVLFSGHSSRMVKRLVHDEELCLDISGGVDGQALDPTLFSLRCHLRKGSEQARLESVLREEVERIRGEGVPREALRAAKNQLRADFVRSLKTVAGMADLLTSFEVYDDGPEAISRALPRYDRVSSEEIQAVVGHYFVDDNRSVVELEPGRRPVVVTVGDSDRDGVGESSPALEADLPPRDIECEPPEPSSDEAPAIKDEGAAIGVDPERARSQAIKRPFQFQFPSYERFVMENGLTVLTMRRSKVPMVTFAVSFTGGGLYAPVGKEGVAPLMARLLRRGTERWSHEELSQAIDSRGGFLGASVAKVPVTVVAEFLAEHSDFALDALAEVLLRPTFPKAELERQRRRGIDGIRSDRGSTRSVVNRFFFGALFGEHSYGRPTSGDEWSLAGLTREDIVAHHRGYVVPQNATLVVVGDFDTAAMRLAIEQRFGSWSGADPRAELALPPAPSPRTESRVLSIEQPGGHEVVFQIGRHALSRLHEDFPSISLLNSLFGGRFTSRLNTVLRIQEGLTYGAGSHFIDLYNTGLFRIDSFSANATCGRAAGLALEVLDQFREKGISQEELDSAKAYLRGQFPTDLETPEQLAEWLLFFERRKLDTSYIAASFAQTEALDLARANELAREHFGREGMQFVFAGEPKAIDGFAEGFGEVTRVPITGSHFTQPYAAPIDG